MMASWVLIWLLSLIVVGYTGYHYRETIEKISSLRNTLQEILHKEEIEKQQDDEKSFLVDPDEIVLRTKKEQEELMRKLNREE